MNASQYHELVDAQWITIEAGIDESGADIDYEISENVLSIDFKDRSQIIINRQEAISEIWLASKFGGFHFTYTNNKWLCSKTGTEFMDIVKQECSKHADKEVSW
ncbi:iron donor protein CyaY [Candidatus Enterovibrio altilux]|uniref:iron donor protein CyaY n=1 Tax=Candidatus Enterovibrio altilux TaxID=1927128 RepID=UPI000BBB8126|nr:iron donor protein CyaY [Candidatus Enterovibrio luxaltus]